MIAPLALLEFGARVLFEPRQAGLLAHRPITDLYPNIREPETIFEEVSGESLEWAPYEHFAAKANLKGKHYSTNSLGLRGPEVSAPKPEGAYRIAVLGGSTAWGYGSSSDNTTVPGYLQAYFAERRPDLTIEVVNAGQPGYVSTQELIFFQRVIAPLEPDLVLLFDGYNDIAADMINGQSGLPQNASLLQSRYNASFEGGLTRQDLARWLRRSRFLAAVGDSILSKPTEVAFPQPASTAAAYVRNVTAIAKLAAPAKVVAAPQPSLALTTKPLALQEQQMLDEKESAFPGYTQFVRACSHAMERALADAGIDTIELDDALGEDAQLLFADECHLGDKGAEKLANALGNGLAGLLP